MSAGKPAALLLASPIHSTRPHFSRRLLGLSPAVSTKLLNHSRPRRPGRWFMLFTALTKTLGVSFFAVATGAPVSLGPLAKAQRADCTKLDASVAKLQTDTPALMKEADVPGMSIVLVCSGKIAWRKNFGVKNVNSGEAVDDGAGSILSCIPNRPTLLTAWMRHTWSPATSRRRL